MSSPFPTDAFDRADETPDALFYRLARLVVHVDQPTLDALTAYYTEVLFEGADVLDLMTSWVSHLPESPALGRVAGLGMNAEELAANPRLTESCVQDLNALPRLPYADESFDFVLNTVSVQYLTRPLEVFAEVGRILRPGGRSIVAMSHRCFPTKAIRAFHAPGAAERYRIVGCYHDESNVFETPAEIDRSPRGADPLWIVSATRKA